MPSDRTIEEAAEALPLVDHHVHGAFTADLTRPEFELAITESDRLGPLGCTTFDSPVGFAVRRWCAPLLDLEPHAPPDDYLDRRHALGAAEVNRRLLTATGVDRFLVDTGIGAAAVLDVDGMRAASGRHADEIVRLEPLAEELAAAGVGAADFPRRLRETVAERTASAVGTKTVVAYRYGLDFDPEPPTDAEVVAAADGWLRALDGGGAPRVTDPVLLRALVWAGVDRGLPLQFHAGFGDPDLDLHRCDPLRLTGFLRLTAERGVPVLLLHNYPFHRHAGYLASVFPHVWFDVGLGVPYTGARASTVVAESLELAPFGKVLFSSDAWGPAELHHLGALLWRRAMAGVLRGFVDAGEWDEADAVRVLTMIGADNARRVYGLTEEYRVE